MGYRASLDYLYSLQRFGIKLGLENTFRLLERLGNPQQGLRIVHIAGTNGKGSTAAALAAILDAAGLRVGRYTSPHLHSFTERIQINGKPVCEATVAGLVAEIRPAAAELSTTFFEFATALALLHFQRCAVDWVVLEVGMGGRLDATNVVTPELTLVTPISLDHAEHLGNSLKAVAGEKAGIFKPGVPVLSARQPLEAEQVIRERARRLQAPLFLAGKDFSWRAADGGFSYQGLELVLDGLFPGLVGRHQWENLSLALAAAELLQCREPKLDVAALRCGIAAVRWPGRLEWFPGQVLLDGAHNPAGAAVLGDYLAEQGLERIHLVVGLKADKAFQGVLTPLLPRTARLYACTPPVEAAVAPAALADFSRSVGVPAEVFSSPEQALDAALAAREGNATVLVAGSLFLVAQLREKIQAMLPSRHFTAYSAGR